MYIFSIYASQQFYMSRERMSQYVFVVHCHQVNILSFFLWGAIMDLLNRVVKNLKILKFLKQYFRGKKLKVLYRHCMTLVGLLHA